MSDIHFPEPFAALTSAVVPVSWWTRAVAWSDLAAHRRPRGQLIVYLLLAAPAAIATGLGIGFGATGIMQHWLQTLQERERSCSA